jgi:hypothetical protein
VGVAFDDHREKAQAVEREREVTLSARELLKLSRSYKPRSKFGNIRTEVDGYKFDSRREARHYGELRLREKAGEISSICVHPSYELRVNGYLVGRYEADFSYVERGQEVVADVKCKATKTPVYRLKKMLMFAIYGITILEVL